MDFEILEQIRDIQPIAVGQSIRDLSKLRRRYGKGRWRKMKGFAHVRLKDGTIHLAELHWYEAHVSAEKSSKSSFHCSTEK